MQIDARTLEQFERRVEVLGDLGPVVENLLRELLRAEKIKTHSITHRVKSKPSFSRKISQKGADYASLEDIHDLLGLRIITYFPDEVDLVAKVIGSEFSIKKKHSVDRRTTLDPDRFGYLSLHYVCELNPARRKLREHARFAGLMFEVQIRSILQHAWAEIEHDRGYTTTEAIPRASRRRFSRLAGLLEMADSEFQALREDLDAYRQSLPDEPLSATGIDRDSVLSLIERSPVVGVLDSELAMIGEQDELGDTDEAYADRLAEKLQYFGFTSLDDVQEALNTNSEVLKRFAAAFLRGDPFGRPPPRGISLFYLAYLLASRNGDREEVERYLNAASLGKNREGLITRLLGAGVEATDRSS